MANIVIIGAGLTGLSAAYHLEKKGFFDYQLFEMESTVGGLCRSVLHDGFTFDYTGHLLHISDAYFKAFIEAVVGFDHFNTIQRRSYIYSHDTYTDYPFQVNLFGLSESVITECIEGFINRPPLHTKNMQTWLKKHSFRQWVQHTFGQGMGTHFFYPYQQKIFSYDINNITASWTGRFVPSTSLAQIIRGALNKSTPDPIGYNATFFYPKQEGISFLINKLAQAIQKPIHTQCTVQQIDTKAKKVILTNGHSQSYDQLITTMPLDCLLACLKESSATSLKRAIPKLLCNKVINFNLGIARQNLSDKHWIYFPETKYPFYRLGFSHNFATAMAPAGYSSLYGEFSYLHASADTIAQTLKQSLTMTKALLGLQDHDIVTEKIIPIEHAYVIYDFWREKNLQALHDHLNCMDIYSVGRYGQWKYSSMQEGLLDGKKIVDQLLVIPAQRTVDPLPPLIEPSHYTQSLKEERP
jgi:protoporphyrinogen oxidase